MDMTISDIGGMTAKLALNGRLDTPGVERIETRFTAAVVPTGKHALVDLSNVTVLTSMGIRMLLSAAKAMHQRKTKMIIFGAQDAVGETLHHVSLAEIIPVVSTEEQALALVK